ncbi:hypothetical protein V6N12_027475 [Hibiscus sabdariffa]|uniref:Uncharacterized protein n=1 Tax=Hibiscus sabdariffa TaxID=183260 RepID=A0ABR2DUS5_9ROSI
MEESDQLTALQPYLLTEYSDKTADHAWLFGRQLNKEPDHINCDASQPAAKTGNINKHVHWQIPKAKVWMKCMQYAVNGRELLLSKTSRRQLNEREERGGKGDLNTEYRNGTLLLRTPFIAIRGTRYLFLVIRMRNV